MHINNVQKIALKTAQKQIMHDDRRKHNKCRQHKEKNCAIHCKFFHLVFNKCLTKLLENKQVKMMEIKGTKGIMKVLETFIENFFCCYRKSFISEYFMSMQFLCKFILRYVDWNAKL